MTRPKKLHSRRVDDKLVKELVIQGDCLNVLKAFEDNSIDAVVTDPPYGLSKEPDIVEVLTKWMAGEPYDHGHGGFMGKSWDSFVPHPDIWREVYRVLKPGGHALVFAGTRTQDLMTIALRLAGFEVRDVIEWLYFSGFPKSLDVSKAFDKRAGAERKKVWIPYTKGNNAGNYDSQNSRPWIDKAREEGGRWVETNEPVSALAQQWTGWGTALKPAHEPIIVVRKPLIDADTGRKLTVVDCVEKYGTGAINIDACRIATEDDLNGGAYAIDSTKDVSNASSYWLGVTGKEFSQPEGRFPANCITLDDDAFYSKYFNITPKELSKKASKKDRNSDWRGEEIGLEEAPTGHGNLQNSKGFERFNTFNRNNHPTVKPTDLMAWLARLITPPGGIVLDPFAGSGSTLVAAKREGFGFVGIEREPEYVKIIEARTHVKAVKDYSQKQAN